MMGFPGGSAGEESACNAGDLGSIPGLGRSSGKGKGCPLQYFGLENSMDCIDHGVRKSQTQLSDFHFTSLHMYVYTHTCIHTYVYITHTHVYIHMYTLHTQEWNYGIAGSFY